MKKGIIVFFFSLFLIFIGNKQINAAEATCVYEWTNFGKVIITIDGINISSSFEKSSNNGISYNINSDNLKVSDFINNSEQFDCSEVSKLYYVYSINGDYVFNVTVSATELSGNSYLKGTFSLVSEESSVDNSASEDEDYMAPKSCYYEGKGTLTFDKESISFIYYTDTSSSTYTNVINQITIEQIEELDYECPTNIYVSDDIEGYRIVTLTNVSGYSKGSLEDSSEEDSTSTTLLENSDTEVDLDISGICTSGYIPNVLYFLGVLIYIAKIIAPVLIIGFAAFDLFGVITGGRDDDFKKYSIIMVKRIVMGVVIFLIPTILNFAFLSINSDYEEVKSKYYNCYTCLLEPKNCEK